MQDREHESTTGDQQASHRRACSVEIVDVGQPEVAHDQVEHLTFEQRRIRCIARDIFDVRARANHPGPGSIQQLARDVHPDDVSAAAGQLSSDRPMPAGNIEHPWARIWSNQFEQRRHRRTRVVVCRRGIRIGNSVVASSHAPWCQHYRRAPDRRLGGTRRRARRGASLRRNWRSALVDRQRRLPIGARPLTRSRCPGMSLRWRCQGVREGRDKRTRHLGKKCRAAGSVPVST